MDLFTGDLNDNDEVIAGNLLLAEPMLFDPNFQRTVILVCEHNDEQGSFGLVINKKASVIIEDPALSPFLEGNLYVGGPVQGNTLHFIHKLPEVEGAISLSGGVFWGGDFEVIKELHKTGMAHQGNCRFFLGYSGWSQGQLAEEVEVNSWVIARISPSIIFEAPADGLWKEALLRMGGKYPMYANYPVDPSQN